MAVSITLGFSLMLAAPSTAFAAGETVALQSAQQQNKINGQVVDENGEPLIGVTVQVKGTKIRTVTDFDGNYSIEAKPGAELEFTYIGYTTQRLKASNGLHVQLKPDAVGLEDVVVIGYGTVKKKDLTGAVAQVKSEDILISPTGNAMEALQGKIAGMDIVKSTGQIGENPEILLRGSRSIYGSNEPLFIIDGVPGSYSEINPSDIETIDVLKDASSTAIYGSAGANGVVMITTKRGNTGSVRVNFDAYYGWGGKPNFEKGMTGSEWTNYQREAYRYVNGSYPTDMASVFGNDTYLKAYNAGKWIDWVDQLSGNNASSQKYSLSVTGGSEKTKIYASAAYTKDQGVLKNDNMEKFAVRLNIDQQLFSWAKIGFTSNLTHSNRNQGVKNTFTKALTSFPLGDVYDSEGRIQHEYISNQYTPLGDFIDNQYKNNTRGTYVNATGYLEINPIDGLSLRTQISGNLYSSRLGQYWGKQANANLPSYAAAPFAQKTHNDSYAYTWENILSYTKTIKDHTFGGTFITSWTKDVAESTIAGGAGYLVDSWGFNQLASGANNRYIYSDYQQTQKMSYAIRLNYSYKGKYLVSFSNRWDGVSWFSEGHKWDSFASGALAWRISEESFMESTKSWLNNLKLRVSYGVTGNAGGTGAYVTQTQAYLYPAWGVTREGNYVQFAQYTGTFAGSDLGWEKSYNWNVGLDFAVVDNRIDGSIEWFNTTTKGLLFKRQLPITSGITGWGSPLSSWQNLAETRNYGIEFTINSRNIQTKHFTWTTSLTGTWEKERILSLPNGDLVGENLFEGSPIRSIYDYKYAGIWGTDTDKATLDSYGVEPGFIKIETVEKVDKDGKSDGGVHKYSPDDRQIIGHKNPNWILGLNNTLTFYGFDFTIYAMLRYGQTIESSLLGYYTAENSVTKNQLAGVKYWTEDNQGAYFPRPGTGSKQTVTSALRIVDGSFIKIKNITLGYTLPKSITRHALIEKCRFYFTAYNPFIFAKESLLKNTDPETGGSDNFPTYKQYVVGVNITL